MKETYYYDFESWKQDVIKQYPNYCIIKGKGYGGVNSWDCLPNINSDFQADIVAVFDEDECFGIIYELK
jgi:hypothetical protein